MHYNGDGILFQTLERLVRPSAEQAVTHPSNHAAVQAKSYKL
jgi:hypothetical protein